MHAFKLMCCIEYSLGQGFIHTMSNGVKIDYLLEQGNFFFDKISEAWRNKIELWLPDNQQ